MTLQKEYILPLELYEKVKHPNIEYVQGDTSVYPLYFLLQEHGQPYDLTRVTDLTLTIKRPNKEVVVGAVEVIDPEYGSCFYSFLGSELSIAGECVCQVQAYASGGKRLTWQDFTFIVRKQLDQGEAIPSQPEYPILQSLIQEVQELAETVGGGDSNVIATNPRLVDYPLLGGTVVVYDIAGDAEPGTKLVTIDNSTILSNADENHVFFAMGGAEYIAVNLFPYSNPDMLTYSVFKQVQLPVSFVFTTTDAGGGILAAYATILVSSIDGRLIADGSISDNKLTTASGSITRLSQGLTSHESMIIDSSGNLNIDLSKETNTFSIVLNRACTVAFTNSPNRGFSVQKFYLYFQTGSTVYNVTWPTSAKWVEGNAPTFAVNTRYCIVFEKLGAIMDYIGRVEYSVPV